MELSAYIPVFIQIVLALAIGLGVIAASHIFGQRSKKNAISDSPYECGIEASGKQHPRFGVRFYAVAMLFVIFDIEIVFMLPFAMVYHDFVAQNAAIVFPVLFFIALMAVGIIYEIKKGALDWNIPRGN